MPSTPPIRQPTATTRWQLWPERRRIRDWTRRRRSPLRPMPSRMQSSIGGRAARTSPISCMKRQRLAELQPRHWQPWTRLAIRGLSSEVSQPASGKRGQMRATDVPELASLRAFDPPRCQPSQTYKTVKTEQRFRKTNRFPLAGPGSKSQACEKSQAIQWALA